MQLIQRNAVDLSGIPGLSFAGMLVGAVMMLVAGYDPIQAYAALLSSAFTQPYDIGETIRTISPLILTGLAVGLAYRTGCSISGWKVSLSLANWWPSHGAEIVFASGDSRGGGCDRRCHRRSPVGLSAGTSKRPGESIGDLTIMMNFIALYLSNVLVRNWLSAGADSTAKIPVQHSLRWDSLQSIFGGARIHMGIILAFASHCSCIISCGGPLRV